MRLNAIRPLIDDGSLECPVAEIRDQQEIAWVRVPETAWGANFFSYFCRFPFAFTEKLTLFNE